MTSVSFHTGGYREVVHPAQALQPGGAPSGHDHDSFQARMFRWITGAFFRKIVQLTLMLPWPIVRTLWSTTSAWTFNALSREGAKVSFREGDVLFLCDASWNYPAWQAARLARRQGAKVVLLMYDLIPLRHPGFCFPLVPPVFALWLRQMLPVAHAIVCISNATEQDLRSYAADAKIVLPPTGHFRLGSDPVRVDPATGAVRDALKLFLAPHPPGFAAIGSFEPKKNYDFLVDAFEQLWARGLDFRLLIMGRETAECHDLIQRMRDHPQQGQKLMTVFDATDAEVAFAYANCRALVFPSSAEGFGLPLVEARVRGSLVIASSLPAFVELADEGVFIYPEGSRSALESLIIAHAQQDLRRGTPRMAAFMWEDSARQCMQLSERLLSQEQGA